VERGVHIVETTELGRIGISTGAIAQIVGHVAAESYGVFDMAGRRFRLRPRDPLTSGIEIRGTDGGLEIVLHVVVEHGLNLAEIASTLSSRVSYEVGRQTGLPVASVDVRIDDVRRTT
jgi:uncharacterized alkaline shock family protein YloU